MMRQPVTRNHDLSPPPHRILAPHRRGRRREPARARRIERASAALLPARLVGAAAADHQPFECIPIVAPARFLAMLDVE
jgi:hypothetical protein